MLTKHRVRVHGVLRTHIIYACTRSIRVKIGQKAAASRVLASCIMLFALLSHGRVYDMKKKKKKESEPLVLVSLPSHD